MTRNSLLSRAVPIRPLTIALLLGLVCPGAARAEAPFQRSVWHPELTEVRLTELETRLGSAVLDTLRQSEPVIDAPLVEAARLYAARDGNPGDSLVAAGVSDAYVVPIRYVTRSKDPLGPVRALLRDHIDSGRMTHFGIGLAPTQGGTIVAILFVRRGAELARFPKMLPLGQRFLLNGRLMDGLDHPLILIASPSGHIVELEPRHRGQVFWLTVAFDDGPGRYAVEVQAHSRYGTQVLNLMEVLATEGEGDTEVPVVRLRPHPASVKTAAEAAARGFQLLNHTRLAMGLPKLILSDELEEEAAAHARDMGVAAYFGHQSPTRGGLGDRLSRARVRHTLALENIALGPSPDSVHADLVRSPSHLRNILDPDVTHVGVGVYEERSGPEPVYIVAQIFARFRSLQR